MPRFWLTQSFRCFCGFARLGKSRQTKPMETLSLSKPKGLYSLSQTDYRHTIPDCQRQPAFHESTGTWLYGNQRLLAGKLAIVAPKLWSAEPSESDLREIERQAEQLVLDGFILVTGIHNLAHQRAAVVPLRWGAPRIVVFSGGFEYHLGKDLKQEPFRIAQLWRYEWDQNTDLAISRRAPGNLPTFAKHNPTVDRLILAITATEPC